MLRKLSDVFNRAEPRTIGVRALLSVPIRVFIFCFVAWPRQVRLRQELRDLSDHLIRDIGKTRDEVRSEAEKPFWK